MDAVRDEGGQALIIVVLVLGIAAVALTGLRAAQEQIVASARERRAGEAAVEAATAVFADAYAAEQRATAPKAPSLSALITALTAARVRDDARAVADSLSLLNGGQAVGEPSVTCADRNVTVALTVGGRRYRAGFAASLCSPR